MHVSSQSSASVCEQFVFEITDQNCSDASDAHSAHAALATGIASVPGKLISIVSTNLVINLPYVQTNKNDNNLFTTTIAE